MKQFHIITILLILVSVVLGCSSSPSKQTQSKSHWREWVYKDDLPPGEMANYYLRITVKVDDLPGLIEKLDDATPVAAPRYMYSATSTVADEALFDIMDIIEDLPVLSFLDRPYKTKIQDRGFHAYYLFVDADPVNRVKFKTRVQKWIDSAPLKQKETWGLRKWKPIEGF